MDYAWNMSARSERAFIVRMWLSEEMHGTGEWRGSVRDVTAERTYYVVETREIADFIANALSSSEPAPNDPDVASPRHAGRTEPR